MKRSLALICSLFILLALAPPGSAAAAKSYSADRFDVDIAVQQGGALKVSETVVFRFAGGPFTFVFRELPIARTDGITDIQATLDGGLLPEGSAPGQVEITGANPIRVEWHFAPTSDSVHTFGLTYLAHGVVSQEANADALNWQALPSDYAYPIGKSTVTVRWADTTGKLVGAPQVTQGRASVETRDAEAIYTATDLRANTRLTIGLRYERGSLIAALPQWQASQIQAQAQAREAAARQAQWVPFFILISALVFFGITLGLLLFWSRYRRESFAPGGALLPNRPPDDLPPAIAGALNGSSPAWPNALATLFDLAQRGVIQIDEIPGRGWFKSRDFALQLLAEPKGLRPHEQALLALLFESKKGKRTTIKMSEVARNVQGRWKIFGDTLKQEMLDLRLLDPVRQKARRGLNIASGVLISFGAVASIGGLFLVNDLGGWFELIPLSVVGAAVVGFVLASEVSPLSEEGARRAAQWQDFYRYLRLLARGKENIFRTDLFELYLPYAATYGLAEQWAKYFQKQSGVQIPSWFHALASSGSRDGSEMGAFVAMMSASNSAGGAGSGAAGAAGAAAGGGASGAG